MEAINYARHARIDVVLVDTAGRMQDNEPLMRALAKLISGTTSTCYKTTTLWCHLEDTVLLIGTVLLFSPILFPKYEA